MKEFWTFSFKVIVAHTLSYFVFGMIMSNLFDYGQIFEQDIIKDFMYPIGSLNVLLGPFLQPLRGLLFAIAIWPIRTIVFSKKNGWLILWSIIVIVGILATPSAAPSSVEGVIYSKLPLWYHLLGFPELLLQTLTFSLIVFWWGKSPGKEKGSLSKSKLQNRTTLFVMAVMISCFAYIGYAIGGILVAKIAGVQIKVNTSSSTFWRTQLMFIVAFIINVISILWLSKVWTKKKINIYFLFLLFWFIDTVVLLIYQFLFSHMMQIHSALLMGVFPAIIVTISLMMNNKKIGELYLDNNISTNIKRGK